MADAAAAFLAALTDAQRDIAGFDFADEAQRRDWSFLPARERDGLPIGALDNAQRKLAHELIVSGTSMHGYTKVVSVIAMEREDRHYFRIQGLVLLIEHDNTQADGAHIHSVWRNPVDDFGEDVLAEHYRQHHRVQPPSES